MLHFITGRPGASKSLNCFKAVCTDKKYAGRPKFYNNIKLNLLDYQQCQTFQAFFYDIYLPSLTKNQKSVIAPMIQPIHEQKRFVTLEDTPFLEQAFQQHDPLRQWLKWVKVCYPASQVQKVSEIEKNAPEGVELTFKDFEHLNLHWTHFPDPHQWFDLQGYSVLVIDEAQEFFPVRSGKDKVPLYASRFEKHRHDSFDVILITQHPNFLDVHLRRLCGHHTHYFNFWGSSKVTRFTWDKCVDPDDHFAKKEGRKSVTGKPKKYFGVYFSAFEHTHKLSLPPVIWLIPILLGAVGFALYLGYTTLTPDQQGEAALAPEPSGSLLPVADTEPQSREQYLEERKPRITGMAHTAPVYDHLTKPRSFPKPQNCVLWREGTAQEVCICYSQRVTRMDVPDYLCKAIVRNGYFDETLSDKRHDRNSRRSNRREIEPYDEL
ncbi:zonular occludens toxin domain-containing protein [Endozoicomonas atrinae]|uniref:zonular occludens toxin domain-containing protein n=1 Tax=Endozoicomonas atrinae TaxID=1333660 RepID=UPI003AFF8B99